MSKEEDMKRLNNEEMKKVNGGWESHTGICQGFDANVNKWHSITISATGSTRQELVKNFNYKLTVHKNDNYYKQFTHSLKPLKA